MEYHQYEMNATMPNIPSQGSSSRVNSLAQPTKEWGLTASDESLSAEQKRAKLEQQLNELDAQIRTETTSKNGVEKLVQFYANDPAAQKKAEAELADSEKKLKEFQENKRKVKAQLVEVNGGSASPEGESKDEASGSASGGGGIPEGGTAEEKVVLVKVRGLFDYVATCDTELSFKEGDILTITEQDESGWWYAEVDGKAGFVPQNYVEVTE